MRHPILVLIALSLLLGCDIANADDRGCYIGIGLGDVAANYKTADFHNDVDKRTTFSGTSDGTGIGFVSLPGGGPC